MVLLDVSIVGDSVVKLQKFAGCVFVGLGGGRKQQSQWVRVGWVSNLSPRSTALLPQEVIDLHVLCPTFRIGSQQVSIHIWPGKASHRCNSLNFKLVAFF